MGEVAESVGGRGDAVFNRLRQVRTEHGVSRRTLANDLGIHYQTVGYLERGEYSPSLQLALRVSSYFGVPIDAIFSLTPFPRVGEEPESSGGEARA